MAGRRLRWAITAGVLIAVCASGAFAQTSAPVPIVPPATIVVDSPSPLEAAPTTRGNAPPPQQTLARIWANEPPLVRLARDHFGESFTETDARFFAAVAANGWADFRPSSDTKYDAKEISSWSQSPTLKADRIVWLCTDAGAVRLVPSHGIWLRGVSIEGKVDLYRSAVPFSLTIYDCLLNGGLTVAHAKLQELDIRNCCSAAVQARGVQVQENVYFNDSCVFGGLDFIDAQIAGDFDFSRGLAFHGTTSEDLTKQGVAINFHDAKVGGDIRLSEKFRAVGQTRLIGAQIGRSFACTDGQFTGNGQTAIDARRCQVAANVLMGGDFKAEGGVEMRRTRIRGDLDCDGGTFIASSVDALNADLVNVGGQVHLGDGFRAEGEVRLINAVVHGDIDCDNGHFLHSNGDSLSLDGAVIGRSLRIGHDSSSATDDDESLPGGFVARGTLRLWGTKIDQDILASGGSFQTPQGTAILACNLRVASRVVLVGVEAQGTVNLFSADIGHELDCRGSQFDARQTADEIAIQANGMHVHGHLYCNQIAGGDKNYNFRVNGTMSVQFATIDMHWDLFGANLCHPGADALDASDCRVGGYVNLDTVAIEGRASFSRAKIDGMWILLNTRQPEQMQLDMRFADIWVIKDERLDDWPEDGRLQLEGLVYDHFDDDSPLGVEDRLQWLRRQYAPSGAATPPDSSQTRTRQLLSAPERFSAIAGGKFVDERSAKHRVTPAAYETEAATQSPPPAEQEPAALTPQMAAPVAAAQDGAIEAETEMASASPEADVTPDPSARRYLTQPYTQLAGVYKAIGQDEQANMVLVARAERIGELAPVFSAQGLWYRYLGRLIGYGYEPFRAIKIGLGIVAIGSIVFAIGNRRNLMSETKLAEHVLSQEGERRLVSATYPRFNPLVYSLDVFLPFVDLQQICYWLPGEKFGTVEASRNCLLHVGPWSLKWSAVLRSYFWFQTLAGWTLCTLLAAAVTGIVES